VLRLRQNAWLFGLKKAKVRVFALFYSPRKETNVSNGLSCFALLMCRFGIPKRTPRFDFGSSMWLFDYFSVFGASVLNRRSAV